MPPPIKGKVVYNYAYNMYVIIRNGSRQVRTLGSPHPQAHSQLFRIEKLGD